MCDKKSDPSLFANCHIFSDSSLPWSMKYFMHGRKTFITRNSVIQRRSDLIIPHMRTAIVQPKSFAYVGPSDWTPCAPGITIPVTYPAQACSQRGAAGARVPAPDVCAPSTGLVPQQHVVPRTTTRSV